MHVHTPKDLSLKNKSLIRTSENTSSVSHLKNILSSDLVSLRDQNQFSWLCICC